MRVWSMSSCPSCSQMAGCRLCRLSRATKPSSQARLEGEHSCAPPFPPCELGTGFAWKQADLSANDTCRYVGYALTTQWEGQEALKLQMIGFDMGGTSTDVSRFAGSYEHVFESTTAGRLIDARALQTNILRAPHTVCHSC